MIAISDILLDVIVLCVCLFCRSVCSIQEVVDILSCNFSDLISAVGGILSMHLHCTANQDCSEREQTKHQWVFYEDNLTTLHQSPVLNQSQNTLQTLD